MSDGRDIFVSFVGAGHSVFSLGVLGVQETRGKEFFSFAFNEDFLAARRGFLPLDPELNFYSGAQYPSNGLFGLFLDSCPDRWGRRLRQRRAAELVRRGLRESARLRESDYLLGVCDETRMGAPLFRLSSDDASRHPSTHPPGGRFFPDLRRPGPHPPRGAGRAVGRLPGLYRKWRILDKYRKADYISAHIFSPGACSGVVPLRIFCAFVKAAIFFGVRMKKLKTTH